MNKINKKNIKKYAVTGVLATTLITGGGLAIYDMHVDHTQEVCPVAKILDNITASSLKDSDFSLGVYHQWQAMEDDYYDKGIYDVSITYSPETIIVTPEAHIMDDGTIVYTAPQGYVLSRDIDGNYICVKNNDTKYFDCTWGEVMYNEEARTVEYENNKILKFN